MWVWDEGEVGVGGWLRGRWGRLLVLTDKNLTLVHRYFNHITFKEL